MQKRQFISEILIALASAGALTACGGGGDATETSVPASVSLLPDGKVGTAGDLVNKAEYEAITCGMTKEQVMAVVVDQPTSVSGDMTFNKGALVWNNGKIVVGIIFSEVVTNKTIALPTAGSTPVLVNC